MRNRKKSPKVVISGYYGFDNCGDEAVLFAIVHCLKKLRPDLRITVLSGNPDKTRKLYGTGAVNRWNPVKVALSLLTCRLLISGGGSLLQDVTSVKSPGYYLGVIRMALLMKKKVMIYSQGVGPLTSEKNRAMAAKTLDRCHVITLRDHGSAELLRELGVKRDILVTCDPVMALCREDADSESIIEILRELNISGDTEEKRKPLLLAVFRNWKDDSHIAPVAKLLDAQAGKGWEVLLAPAHYPIDNDVNVKIADRMTVQPYIIDKCLTAREFLALTAHADMVFSMRLHGLICAMAVGTPMVGLSYDPKVESFADAHDIPLWKDGELPIPRAASQGFNTSLSRVRDDIDKLCRKILL